MSMMTALLALATAARLPKPTVNADVEVTRLKEELRVLKSAHDALHLTVRSLIEERHPPVIVPPDDPRLGLQHEMQQMPIYRDRQLAQIRNCAPGRADMFYNSHPASQQQAIQNHMNALAQHQQMMAQQAHHWAQDPDFLPCGRTGLGGGSFLGLGLGSVP